MSIKLAHRCEKCKAWKKTRRSNDGEIIGECHFNPPQRVGVNSTEFPETSETDWCAQFQHK